MEWVGSRGLYSVMKVERAGVVKSGLYSVKKVEGALVNSGLKSVNKVGWG